MGNDYDPDSDALTVVATGACENHFSLAADRRLQMFELADAIVLSRSGLTRLVDRLDAGVARHPARPGVGDPDDRRGRALAQPVLPPRVRRAAYDVEAGLECGDEPAATDRAGARECTDVQGHRSNRAPRDRGSPRTRRGRNPAPRPPRAPATGRTAACPPAPRACRSPAPASAPSGGRRCENPGTPGHPDSRPSATRRGTRPRDHARTPARPTIRRGAPTRCRRAAPVRPP